MKTAKKEKKNAMAIAAVPCRWFYPFKYLWEPSGRFPSGWAMQADKTSEKYTLGEIGGQLASNGATDDERSIGWSLVSWVCGGKEANGFFLYELTFSQWWFDGDNWWAVSFRIPLDTCSIHVSNHRVLWTKAKGCIGKTNNLSNFQLKMKKSRQTRKHASKIWNVKSRKETKKRSVANGRSRLYGVLPLWKSK